MKRGRFFDIEAENIKKGQTCYRDSVRQCEQETHTTTHTTNKQIKKQHTMTSSVVII